MAVIDITVRHGDLKKGIESFVRSKAERLDKYLREDSRIEFVLDKDHEVYTCEAIVHSQRKGGPQVVHSKHSEIHACIDEAIEKMRVLLGKDKDRRKDHHRGVGLGEEFSKEPGADGSADREGEEPTYEDVVDEEVRGD